MSPVLWYAATHPLRFDAQHTYARAYNRERGASHRYTFGSSGWEARR